jgi:hypothetical protein
MKCAQARGAGRENGEKTWLHMQWLLHLKKKIDIMWKTAQSAASVKLAALMLFVAGANKGRQFIGALVEGYAAYIIIVI